MKKVETKILLPFSTWTLDSKNLGVPSELNFRGIDFKYNSKLKDSSMEVTISFNTIENIEKNDLVKLKELSMKAIEFMNHYIYHARTFDHSSPEIVLVSPRTVKKIDVNIFEDKKLFFKKQILLTQELPKYFEEYFDYLNEPGAFDAFEELVKDESSHLLYINLVLDSFYSIYEGKYNECVINCCTALEAIVTPRLRNWLTQKFHHKNPKNADRILMETPMSLKYELLFGSVEKEYLSAHESLLEKLKEINSLRNSIIHRGIKVNKTQAEDCLNHTSKFIQILHFKLEPNDFIDYEK